MSRSIKNNRPTASGALLEVLLVLAVCIVVVFVYRGWFAQSDDSAAESNEQRRGSRQRMVDSEDFAKSSRDLR